MNQIFYKSSQNMSEIEKQKIVALNQQIEIDLTLEFQGIWANYE